MSGRGRRGGRGRGGGGRSSGRGAGGGPGGPGGSAGQFAGGGPQPMEFSVMASSGFPFEGCPAQMSKKAAAHDNGVRLQLADRTHASIEAFMQWFVAGLSQEPDARLVMMQGSKDDKKSISSLVESVFGDVLQHGIMEVPNNKLLTVGLKPGATPPADCVAPRRTEEEPPAADAVPATEATGAGAEAQGPASDGPDAPGGAETAAVPSANGLAAQTEEGRAAAAPAPAAPEVTPDATRGATATQVQAAVEHAQEVATAVGQAVGETVVAAAERVHDVAHRAKEAATEAGADAAASAKQSAHDVKEKATELASEAQAVLQGQRGPAAQTIAVVGGAAALGLAILGLVLTLAFSGKRRK